MTDTPPTPMPDSPPEPEPGAPKTRGRKSTQESVAPGATGTTPKRERPKATPKLQKQLEELFAMPALAYGFVGDEWASNLIATRTPLMAEAWYELAEKNPAIKRVLNRLVEGSAWGGVVASTAAVTIPLMQHHGFIPGADPFAAMYAPLPPENSRGPIVPPPPAAMPGRPSRQGAPDGGGGAGQSPAGVVTVAQSNNNAAGT